MEGFKPQEDLLAAWRLVFSVAMFLPAFVVELLFPRWSAGWYVASGVWLLVFFGLYLLYLPLLFRRLHYEIINGRVYKMSGFVYSSVRSFPVDGIQYVTLLRSPLDRMFGLYSVVLVVAGGRMLLAGLSKGDADDLAMMIHEGELP